MEPNKTKILSLLEATKHVPALNGKHPHVCTLYRWYSVGIAGARLQCVRVGGKLGVTQEALDRFFVEAGAAGPQHTGPRAKTKANGIAPSRAANGQGVSNNE